LNLGSRNVLVSARCCDLHINSTSVLL
jgi:hypothetical protein